MQFLCLVLLLSALRSALPATYNCSSLYERVPNNNDLAVDCRVNDIALQVNLCTALWAGFTPSSLALNSQHNSSLCQGTVDTSVDPPVIRFQLPVNDSQANPCRQSLQIVNEVPSPSGPFSQFSSIQSVIITGYIDTPMSSLGVISYSTDLYYHFTCRYPLEYLLNDTKIVASSVSVATSDKNGSFIDTLSMSVFNDSNFIFPLVVPSSGLPLRTKVYVQVKAINLTGNFNILLDHCFATPFAYSSNNSGGHDFFTGCTVDTRTSILWNGVAKNSTFNFETFRFMQYRDQDKSSIYIHCILKLCEPDKCLSIVNACNGRRRRAADPGTGNTDTATVSMGPLYAAAAVDSTDSAGSSAQSGTRQGDVTGPVLGAVFGTVGVVLLGVAGWVALKKVYWVGGLPYLMK